MAKPKDIPVELTKTEVGKILYSHKERVLLSEVTIRLDKGGILFINCVVTGTGIMYVNINSKVEFRNPCGYMDFHSFTVKQQMPIGIHIVRVYGEGDLRVTELKVHN
jgi:hypothetical protein